MISLMMILNDEYCPYFSYIKNKAKMFDRHSNSTQSGSSNQLKKEMKITQIGKEEIKLFLLANNITVNVGNPSSVKFSHSIVSDSFQPHGLQHARLPCPSPTPKNTQTHVPRISDVIQPSHPLSVPFSSCLQSFPASGSFPMSQFFT